MADNVAITAGSGTSIAADDISSVWYQRVKIGLGADGTAVDMVGGTGVDGTGVPRVTLATNVGLPAGTAAIGKVKVTNDAGTVIDPVAAGTAAMAASIPVTIATNDTQFGEHIRLMTSLAPTTATFAIAAAAYTSGDCVSTAQTFTTVGASGKQVMIVGASLSIDHTTAIASSFRLHLFNAAKAVALADNDPHTVLSADLTKYLGYFDFTAPVDIGTICWVERNDLTKPVLLSTANIVAQLEIITGLTPAASNLKVTLLTVPLS